MRFKLYILLTLSLFAFSCETSDGDTSIPEQFAQSVSFTISPNTSSDSEGGVRTLRAYIFRAGVLDNILSVANVSSSGKIAADIEFSYISEFLLLANADESQLATIESKLEVGTTTIGELSDLVVLESYCDSTNVAQPLFTGYEMATDLMGSKTVQMERTTAQVDIELEAQADGAIEINSIHILGASKSVVPFHQFGDYKITSSQTSSYKLNYQTPLTTSSQEIYEINQGCYEAAISVVIDAVIDGVPTEIIRTMPNEISGQNRYIIRVASNGSGGVTIAPFDEEDNESDLDGSAPLTVAINKSASTIPSGMTLSSDNTTIYTPFSSTLTATLQLEWCADDKERTLYVNDSQNDELKITNLGGNRFELTMTKAYLGAPNELWFVDVLEDGSTVGTLTIEREGYPLRMNGKFLDYVIDRERFEINTFIDGELFEFSTSKNYTFELEGDWVRFEPTALAQGRYIVEGGWKPNDTEAKGEVQTASFKVFDETKQLILEYPMSRRNYSLPVVEVAGIWWCKFPLRGDRTNFEEQILPTDEIANVDIYQYLKTCSSEDFFNYFGTIYQGLNPTPLDITYGSTETESGWQITDGVDDATHIGTTDGSALSPGGYILPTTDDVLTHLWTGTWNVTGGVIPENADVATLGGYNHGGRRYRFRPFYRTDMTHNGHTYPFGFMEIADVGEQGSNVAGDVVAGPLVWVAPGHATANGVGNFYTLVHKYAFASSLAPLYITVSGSNFVVSYTSSGGSFIPYTHRCMKIPNDFILE